MNNNNNNNNNGNEWAKRAISNWSQRWQLSVSDRRLVRKKQGGDRPSGTGFAARKPRQIKRFMRTHLTQFGRILFSILA